MKKYLIFWVTSMAVFSAVHIAAASQNQKENTMTLPLPKIIAHRGGPNDWPPNTVCAFRKDMEAGVDAIELDVQVTKDNVVVLFHPEDLSEQTNVAGKIADKTAAEVTALDASAKYKGPADFQQACTPNELKIPKLTDVLNRFPNTTFFVDLKSLPAEPLVKAIARDVPKKDFRHIIFYSTNAEHIVTVEKYLPQAPHFEERATTFNRLITFAGTHQCTLPNKASYVGFELSRDLDICEKFKLGGNCFKTSFEMWSPESFSCSENMTQSAKIIFFGIDTPEAYEQAWSLGAYGVYSNSPKALIEWKRSHQGVIR